MAATAIRAAEPVAHLSITAPARLHLGLFDWMDSAGVRRSGGIGVAVDRPALVMEAEPGAGLTVRAARSCPGLAGKALEAARVAADALGIAGGARLYLRTGPPPHAGLGSGTQVSLAAGTAVALLHGARVDVEALAAATGRGGRSRVGVEAFRSGGVVIDARLRWRGGRAVYAGPESLPTVVSLPAPARWAFVIAVPSRWQGLSGAREAAAFRRLPAMPERVAAEIHERIAADLVPALRAADIARFGRAVTAIQRRVGDHFAALQGGCYTRRSDGGGDAGELVERLLAGGAYGAGQSSWGPAVYGLIEDGPTASALCDVIRRHLAERGGGRVFIARVRPAGAEVTIRSFDRRSAPHPNRLGVAGEA